MHTVVRGIEEALTGPAFFPTQPILWLLAAAMAVVTSYSLKWTVQHRGVKGSLMLPFVVFVLVMMLSMVVSAVIYFLSPSTELLVTLVVANMIVMGAGSLPFVLVIFSSVLAQSDGGTDAGPDLPQPAVEGSPSGAYAAVSASLVGLVLLNEFFMGWAFGLASGTLTPSASTGIVAVFSDVVGSYWFLFTMSLEMVLTVYFLRAEIRREFLYVVAFQSVVMFLSPTAIVSSQWVGFSVFAGSAGMVVLYIYAFEYLARNRAVEGQVARYLLSLMAAYAVMMAGIYVWQVTSSEDLFALSIVLEMVIYLNLVLGGSKDLSLKQWHSQPWWVLGLLSALFVGEFFMGAVLDAQINGAQDLISGAGLVPLTGGPLSVVASGLYDFVAFFGSVTASPWFLIMMGTEMGALVAFRIRTVRELETRVRLVLMMVAYAVYAILLPSFLIPGSALPSVPFVGWSMGAGTAGPVAPALLVALVGTYFISGGLSFLFGSRQVCSMFCTAALMYQGTFYDSMKNFNRSSKVGRKFLTSRLSGLYKASFSLVWASLIAAIGISYLDSVGILNLSIFGSDPTTFLYTFYFGFLWYIIFVTIPFVGTYGCVSMGWCHWGTFNQLVSRLGFFKLKVRDPSICVTCATKDCAKACPVGLTDLPGSFIAKGEFKSMKCIGVGDCVSACPYSNEYFFDVRHWLRRKGRKVIALEAASGSLAPRPPAQ
jgi:polyferredoxin